MAGYKGNTASANVLKLVFQAVAWANVADNAATSPLTNLFVALHTADPTAANDQTSSEATYTNYARVSVARTSSGWSISGQTISNVAAINFPACGTTGNTITHASVGTTTSGADTLLYAGPLGSSLVVSTGITPSFAIGALTVTEG